MKYLLVFQKNRISRMLFAVTGLVLLLQCTASSNEGIRAEADGTIQLTAENGQGIGPDIEYMPEWKAFGWFTAKDSVVWEVEIEKEGEYEVILEWSVSNEEAGKTFVFYSNNREIKGKVERSGSWETFKKDKIGAFQLAKGKQTMVFKSETDFEEGALLDLRALTLLPVIK